MMASRSESQLYAAPEDTFSPGLPIGPAMEAALQVQLSSDSCIRAAEASLHNHGINQVSPYLKTASLRSSKL